MAERPLTGVRVIELATEIAGPYGGRLLCDLGAEVIKVEPPTGDGSRGRGPFPGGSLDPEQSGLFLYLNAGKRGVVVDCATETGRHELQQLCAAADVVVEDLPAGALERAGCDLASLQAIHPRLVLVSVSPFGRSGPRSGWAGNDLIAFHSAGIAYGFPALQADAPDQPPLNAPSYAAALLAGEMVAGAVAHGLNVVRASGRGCHLDLSLQEAVAAENQSQYSAVERGGSGRRTFSTEPSNPTVALLPCRDGWVAISPREEHQWLRWLGVMGNPAWGAEPRFADRRSRERNWAALYPLLAAWSVQQAKADVFEAAQSARVACYPLGEATDLLSSPQLRSRGFFRELEVPGSATITVPGVPYQLDGAAVERPATAPRLGEHTPQELRAAIERGPAEATLPPAAVQPEADRQPLRGVRVVDFSWVLTGPICTKYLAALGAEVIKIESRARPDLSQRDVAWEELNPSKRSITLNMQQEEARDLARRLIARSDVVIENFSTGVMERLGLDWETLRTLNPRLIMLSSSALGRTGPERERVAYGTLIQCFTGWAGLSAQPGSPPRSSAGIWTDPLTATMATFLLLAAIWRQQRTGAGCFFDLSMAETTIAALPEPLLTWGMSREVLQPRGNRDPIFAPQGCYPAAPDSGSDSAAGGQGSGDRWLSLSVRSDAEWVRLCAVLGRDDLRDDSVLVSAAGRRARHDRLDLAIATWTRQRPAAESAALLQAQGIAATPTLSVADALADEQLQARAFWSEVERIEGGTRRTLGFPWLVNGERPDQFRRPPRVGEDNERIFQSLLGLDAAEYARLVEAQVIY